MYKKTREVRVGSVCIGGDSRVSIQSMTSTKTTDIEKTVNQIKQLYTAGADLVRVAVPSPAALDAFSAIRKEISKPLIADIHFDYKLALGALRQGADKVRINPGNIKDWSKVKLIIDEAQKSQAALRIGVNSGSLESGLKRKYGGPTIEALVESAINHNNMFLDYGFDNFVVSIKSSRVKTTIAANRLFAQASDTPLHLGVTEAGTPNLGEVKAAIGIGSLLNDGIGDTFRVTLTADPVVEVALALKICKALGLRKEGLEIISCPTCGRTPSDLISIVNEVEQKTKHIKTPLTVAIMGCVVNGPGEAEEADLGLALGKGRAALFRNGKVIRTIEEEDYVQILLQEIANMAAKNN